MDRLRQNAVAADAQALLLDSPTQLAEQPFGAIRRECLQALFK